MFLRLSWLKERRAIKGIYQQIDMMKERKIGTKMFSLCLHTCLLLDCLSVLLNWLFKSSFYQRTQCWIAVELFFCQKSEMKLFSQIDRKIIP